MAELQTRNEEVAEALNLDPITGAPGAHPIGTGVGATGGAVAGMAIGSIVAGPLGSAVGGTVGAIAGGLAGKGVGEAVNPTAEVVFETVEPLPLSNRVDVSDAQVLAATDRPVPDPASPDQRVDPVAEDLYWQRAFITEPYYDSSLSYDDYGPAYRAGIAYRLGQLDERSWDEVEPELQELWLHRKGHSRLDAEQSIAPMRAAWHRVDHALRSEDVYFGTA